MPDRRALGRLIPAPIDFNPTQQWLDHNYRYQLDLNRGVCHRSPLHSQADPAGYYLVIELGVVAAPLPSQLKAQTPSSFTLAHKKPTWRRLAGSAVACVMAAAAALVAYPYFPEAAYQARQVLPQRANIQAAPADQPISPQNHLSIPRVGVSANILESPTLDILDIHEGVWHQTGQMPNGNLVLAGHRFKYLPPNTSTFYNLGKVTAGDVVVVDWERKRYVYVVREVKTVDASAVEVLNQTGPARLTMYTCDDKKETRRIVVTADPLP